MGADVGSAEGVRVGSLVGMCVGFGVGDSVRAWLGVYVGSAVGDKVGSALGVRVGALVGLLSVSVDSHQMSAYASVEHVAVFACAAHAFVKPNDVSFRQNAFTLARLAQEKPACSNQQKLNNPQSTVQLPSLPFVNRLRRKC